jgi:hypothetical protein
LISLLILVLIVGAIYYVATLFLPHPFPQAVLVIGAIIIIVALVQLLAGASDGGGLHIGD